MIHVPFDPEEEDGAMIGPATAVAGIAVPGAPSMPTIPELILHYKADAITGLADLDVLTTFNDSSGNGHHADAVTTAKPVYHSTGAGMPNGLPYITLDGVDDMLSIPSVGPLNQILTACTFLAVVKSGNTLAKVLLQTRSTLAKSIRQGYTAGKWEHWDSPTAVEIGNISTTNWQIIKTQGMNTHSWIWTIGSETSKWAGDLAEMIVCNTGCSVANYDLAAAYLQAKYAL